MTPPLPPRLPLHRRLRRAGIAILVGGLLAALVVFATSDDSGAADAGSYSIVGGQAYANDPDSRAGEMAQLQRLGGNASVQTLRFDGWLGSLWHGWRLSATLLVLSGLVGGLCLHIAGLMREEAEEAEEAAAAAAAAALRDTPEPPPP